MVNKVAVSRGSGVTPSCPQCGRALPSEDVNPAKDVAYCRNCNLASALSRLVHGPGIDLAVDPANPPPGAWYRSDGLERVVGATHRSVGGAMGTLFFCLFWNGIVSVFVLFALASTLRHLDIAIPQWFPAPDMDGSSMSTGMTIFLWIFLTPFIAVGVALAAAFLSCIGGRTEVRISESDGVIFSGIGVLGLRKRFDRSTVKEVRVEDQHWRDSDGDRRRKTQVVIETMQGRTLRFGSMLTEDRRRFVAAAVRAALAS